MTFLCCADVECTRAAEHWVAVWKTGLSCRAQMAFAGRLYSYNRLEVMKGGVENLLLQSI